MLKKILMGALIILGSFGIFGNSEACHCNYDNCGDNYYYCR